MTFIVNKQHLAQAHLTPSCELNERTNSVLL